MAKITTTLSQSPNNVDIPNLQKVTDEGNSTNNSISVTGNVNINPEDPSKASIQIRNQIGEELSINNNFRADSFIKLGGTSSEFLKADGSVDSTVYAIDSNVVHKTGNETISGLKTFTTGIFANTSTTDAIIATSNKASGIIATSNSVPWPAAIFNRAVSGIYADIVRFNKEGVTVAKVTDQGSFSGLSFIKTGGTSSQFLKADGSIDSNTYATTSGVVLTTTDQNINGTKTFTGSSFTKIIVDTGNGQGVFGGVGFGSNGVNFYSQNQGTGSGIYANTASSGTAALFETSGSGSNIISNSGSTGKVFIGQNTGISTSEIDRFGNITGNSFIKSGGLSTQFLMADGSVTTGGGGGGSTDLTYTPSPTNGIVVSSTGTDATIPLADFTNAGLLSPTDKQLLYNDSSTGVIAFGGLSINADTTKFDVGAIKAWFINNYTDPLNPTKQYRSFSATTANVVPNIATQNVSYLAIDINGVLQFSASPFTNELQRDYCVLGVLVHSNRVVINAVNNQPVVVIDAVAQISDLMEGIGFFNITGNVFSPNGANLNINKSYGHVFKQGSNFVNSNKDPHTLITPALTAPTNIRYRLQNGTEYANTAVIDSGFYDNAGVRTAVPGNKYSIQRIYIFQSNLIRIQYGQALYSNMAEAIQAVATEPFVVEQNILENGLFRGLLIVKENVTNLTDTTKALFIEASKFGSVAGLGSLSTTSLQQAYNNSTVPLIVTDSVLDGFSVRNGTGSADNITPIYKGQNTAGTNTFQVNADGATTALSFIKAGGTSGQYLMADGSTSTGAGGSAKSINSVSTNTAAGSTSSTDYFYFGSGTINITLPTAVGNTNNYTIKNVGTGVITIDTTSSQAIDGSLTAPINVQYLSLTIISDGANWNII
jgi:hypothetical protein